MWVSLTSTGPGQPYSTGSRRASSNSMLREYDAASGALRDGDQHALRQVDEPVRVSPLVVVPGDDLHAGGVDRRGQARVEDRRIRRLDDVGGDERLVAVLQDALEVGTARAVAEDRVDLAGVDGPLGLDGQVDARARDDRHAQRETVQPALELGNDEPDRLGRAGRRRDDVHAAGARTALVLVRLVQDALVAGVGVHGRQQAVADADRLVQHLGDGREAV